MIFKSLIKRPKQEQDYISKLPDELLTHILSLLPDDADANRTRILSNRWSHLWAFLPNLHFVMPFCWSNQQVNKFHDFVDQTLALRGGNMPIKRFFLYCSKKCDYTRVSDWLRLVVTCRVQEIDLRFPNDRYRVKFCWDLFKTCNTLVALTLKGEFELCVPRDDLLFPCLKKIELLSVVYSGDWSFENLISGCPVLEELFVERQVIGQSDNLKTFKVFSSSLKRLRISCTMCVSGVHKVVIDAPKLEYLSIVDLLSTDYSLTKPLFLEEAYIMTRSESRPESIDELMACLSSVKILTLTDSSFMALNHSIIPMFPNMVKFVVGIDVIWGWNLLTNLFDHMPNLEHIRFCNGLLPFPRAQHNFSMRWNPPMETPACLRFKMKEITICNCETVTQEEFPLIRYLLIQSKNLELLKLNAHKIDNKRRKAIMNFPRAKLCTIEFV